MPCIRPLSSIATRAAIPKNTIVKASPNLVSQSQSIVNIRSSASSRILSMMTLRDPTSKPVTINKTLRLISNQTLTPFPIALPATNTTISLDRLHVRYARAVPKYALVSRRWLSRSTARLSTPPSSKPNPSLHGDESIPAFNIWAQIHASRPAVRYTIYTGFALAAIAETSFWANVIYAKWFAGEEDKERAEVFLERFREAIKGYRARWMVNYGNYWGANLWGL